MSIKSGENCCTPNNPDRVQFIALLPFSSWDGLCKWLMLGVLTFKSGIIHIFQPKPKTVEEMSKSENIPIIRAGNNFWQPACQNDQYQWICVCHKTKCTGHSTTKTRN